MAGGSLLHEGKLEKYKLFGKAEKPEENERWRTKLKSVEHSPRQKKASLRAILHSFRAERTYYEKIMYYV